MDFRSPFFRKLFLPYVALLGAVILVLGFIAAEVVRGAFTAFAAPGTFERHMKIPLPDALPDCKTKLKCNEDDDHPFQEI